MSPGFRNRDCIAKGDSPMSATKNCSIVETRVARRRHVVAPLVLSAGVALAACANVGDLDQADEDELSIENSQQALLQQGANWPSGNVRVCFTSASASVPNYAQVVANIQVWLRNSWMRAAKVQFTDFTTCSVSPNGFIRVNLCTTNCWHNSSMGYFGATGWGNMTLNVTDWNLPTAAVHEFGHTLGFQHEGERADHPYFPDNPACSDGTYESGNTLGTPADIQSIMSSTGYCQNNPWLSMWDRHGVQNAYGRSAWRDSSFAGQRTPEHMDIFRVTTAGTIKDANWTPATGWQAATITASGLPASAHVSATARLDGQVDAYAIDSSGRLVTTWGSPSGWASWVQLTGTGVFSPGGYVASISRHQDRVDVVSIGQDGALKGVFWTASAGWSGLVNYSAAGVATPGVKVAISERRATHMDFFFAGSDGSLKTAWWSDPNNFGAASSILPAGTLSNTAKVVSIADTPTSVYVFAVKNNGRVVRAYWSEATWAWNTQEFSTSTPSVSSDIAAIQSWTNNLVEVFYINTSGALSTVQVNNNSAVGSQTVLTGNSWTNTNSKLGALTRYPNSAEVFAVQNDGVGRGHYRNSVGWQTSFYLP